MSVFTGLTDFDPVPSLQRSASVTVSTKAPDTPVIGHLVAQGSAAPDDLDLSSAQLEAAGFEGKVGQTIVLPAANGPLTRPGRCR